MKLRTKKGLLQIRFAVNISITLTHCAYRFYMQTSFYCTDWVSVQLACTCPLTSAQEWCWLILQPTFLHPAQKCPKITSNRERRWEIWNSAPTRLTMPPSPLHTPRFAPSTPPRAAALHLWDAKDHHTGSPPKNAPKKVTHPNWNAYFTHFRFAVALLWPHIPIIYGQKYHPI